MRGQTFRKVAGWTGIVLALLVWTGVPADGDDTQLFRSEAGKPYVFIVLDTSTSMNVAPATNAWVPASGDDPDEDGTGPDQGAKFRLVKEALLEVFGDVYKQNGDTVHFGFSGFNQDRVKVRGKHWLYRVTQIENPLSVDYPRVGDVLTFGKHFELGAGTVDGTAGSCTAPLNVSTAADRTKLHRFAKLNPRDTDGDGFADAYDPTMLWLKSGSDTYLLEVTRFEGNFGGPLKAKLTMRKKNPSDVCPNASNPIESIVHLDYVTEFLMSDEGTGATNASAQLLHCTGNEKNERTAGVGWTWQDVSAIDTCGGQKPFSGKGWEGNYDGLPLPSGFSAGDNVDPGCTGASCYSVKHANELGTARPLDRGDMLPYHWSNTNRVDFFRRLAPNWEENKDFADLEFRAAAYYRDAPRAGRDYLELRNEDLRPLLPFGASPLTGAIVDFRCFYLGKEDNKCKIDEMPFGSGWDDLAKTQDLEFGCRKPFLIVVGDGESHGNANDATSAVANLKNVGLAKTWAIDFGGTCASNSTYHSLTNSGGGECVFPQTKDELVDVLRKIVGVIIEQTKSFSSAAVPTVQADVADRVFLSNFTPLNDEVAPVWPGHMNAFVKAVPLTADRKPDTSTAATCPPPSNASCTQLSATTDTCPANSRCVEVKPGVRRCLATTCFLWDAGTQLLTQVQPDAGSQNGPGEAQRRIYYSELETPGQWPNGRHYFKPLVASDPMPRRHDFWRGLGLSFFPLEASESTNSAALATGNEVVREALAIKLADLNAEETPSTADDTPFILGDIFHSTPVVVGSPANTLYFALDVDGYREFTVRHEKRRKMLLVGANDGMLHAFDAGNFDTSIDRFTNGSGKEVFAFLPRAVLPTIKDLYAGEGENRTWTLDGNLTVADVRIDPLFAGTPDDEGDDGPEWRTVVVGGLREGGVGYYALDITQPDKITDGLPLPGAGDFVPSCMGADPAPGSVNASDCGPVPYPAQLWEFRDGVHAGLFGRSAPLDEDGNGTADLTEGWSTPNIGRIRVIDVDGEQTDRYVAIFGGGLDKTERAGNWIYMVDMETGKALYKHRVLGSVPAEPSAVDTDQDGYLDRIYFGTTRGYVYRVDLRRANPDPAVNLPELEEVTVTASILGIPFDDTMPRIIDPDFAPRVVFKAQPTPEVAAVPSRPIYYRASVIYIARLNRYAVAFGTGDRENLFNFDGQSGRFYIFRDDVGVDDRTTFYTEADLQAILPTDAPRSEDFVTETASAKRGWFLALNPNERLITNPFALSGILVFTAFTPNPTPEEPGTGRPKDTLFCRRDGSSRIFGVTASNANALLLDTTGAASRFKLIGDFVTDPYSEQGVTKNPVSDRPHADDFPAGEHLGEVLDQLKALFPPNCKFGNFRIDVKTLSSDTGVVFIAPVPVCVIEKNWREF